LLGGTGGGAVNVNVSGYVGATGAASPSIYAQSSQNGGRSTSGAPVTININQNATISGGADYYHGGDGRLRESRYSTAITTQTDLRNEPSNAVNVNGIVTSVGGASSSAIFSYGGTTFVHNAPTG